jgi:hypothetical protein
VLWSASESGSDYGFGGLHSYKVLPWRLKGKPKASKFWPEHVQRFWIQAHQSAGSEIWDGVSVMARSAMQVAFRDQGAVGRTLKNEVDDLSEKGLLPRVMKEWATELRLLGNEAAHPDVDLIEANPQDIRDGLKFLDQLLSYLYDLPAAIRDRERRAEKQ